MIESCEATSNLTTQEIKFTSSNSSDHNHSNCNWQITVPSSRVVILTLNEINIKPSFYCEQSFLEFYDGPNENSSRLSARICGSSMIKTFESTGNKVFLRYSSNVDYGSDQFTICYRFSGTSS